MAEPLPERNCLAQGDNADLHNERV